MQNEFYGETTAECVRNRLDSIGRTAQGTIGAALRLELLECNKAKGEYLLLAHTCNVIGTLHGGRSLRLQRAGKAVYQQCLVFPGQQKVRK